MTSPLKMDLSKIVIRLTALLTVIHFIWITNPVRLANSDDVDHHQTAQSGRIESYAVTFAQAQGRFHHATLVNYSVSQLHAISSDWGYNLVRSFFVFAQLGLLAWLGTRLSGSERLGWLAFMLLAGMLHLPATYFATLSYPTLWVGFGALLGSLHLHLTWLRNPKAIWALASGTLFLLSLLMQEMFCVFFPALVALSLMSGRRGWNLVRSVLPQAAALSAYLAAYLAFVRLYPSTYDGTQFNANPAAVFNVVVRNTFTVLPGFELLAHRTFPTGGGAWLKSSEELWTVFAITPVFHYLLALLQGLSVLLLLRQPAAGQRPGWKLIFVVVSCALLPNLLIGLVDRYQIFAHQRQFPYVYAFYVFGGLMLAVGLGLERLLGRLSLPIVARHHLAATVALISLLGFISAKVSNHHTVMLLQQWYN